MTVLRIRPQKSRLPSHADIHTKELLENFTRLRSYDITLPI